MAEVTPYCDLVRESLFRELLPLLQTRFLRFREKHGANKEGFAIELKRLNVLDEVEMRRMTHAFFFTKVPTLVWLIEWTLTIAMRQVFGCYEWHEPFPYVIVDPYLFLGHLFQTIASQWLMLLHEKKDDMSIHELDKFLKTCLQKHIEKNVPIVPHNSVGRTVRTHDWHEEMKQLHDRLWTEPDLRPYIRYHTDWFKHFLLEPVRHTPSSQLGDNNGLAKDIRTLQKAIFELADTLKRAKLAPQPPNPLPAPLPPPPLPTPASLPVPVPPIEAQPKVEEKRRRKHSPPPPPPVLDTSDDDDGPNTNTISAKLASSSSSSSSDSENNSHRKRRHNNSSSGSDDD